MLEALGLRRGVKTAAAAVVACAAALLVLFPLAFSNRVVAFGDNVSFWAPSTAFWTAEVADGRLPLWNPYVLGGVPFAADINHGLFYPPNWLPALLGAPRALSVLVLLHVALGAFGMYLFLESEEVPSRAAAWGGVAFAISTCFLPLANHIVMLESMSYLPLVLFAASRLARGGRWKASLMLGVFLALSALAGDVHATYMAALAAAAFLALQCTLRIIRREAREAAATAAFFALGAVAALVLAAAALLPAAQLAATTGRALGAGDYTAYHGLDPKAAAGIVAPAFWGSLRDGNVWNFRWDNGVYLGAPLLLLACWGGRRLARGLAAFVLVILGAGLAFGAYSPLWHLAGRILPAFRIFRQPREYFIIAAVGVILLASHGVGDLARVAAGKTSRPKAEKGRRRRPWTWFLVAPGLLALAGVAAGIFPRSFAPQVGAWLRIAPESAAPAVGACITKSLGVAAVGFSLAVAAFLVRRFKSVGPIAAWCLAAVVLGDLALSSNQQTVYGPGELYGAGKGLASAVRAATDESVASRFVPVGPGFGEYFAAFASRNVTGGMTREQDSFEVAGRLKQCLVDNEPVYARLESALGYSTFLSNRYVALYEIATGIPQRSPVRLRGVREADWRLLGAGAVLEYSPRWREPRMLKVEAPPTIFMAYDWHRAPSFEEARERVRADPSRALVSPVVEGLTRSPRGHPDAHPPHSIEDIRRGADSLSLLVHTDQPGLLVVLENNYPGWKAFDNGVQTRIFTANLTFRAVYLTSGRHEVSFAFRPRTVYAGMAVSLAAFAAVAAACVAAGIGALRR